MLFEQNGSLNLAITVVNAIYDILNYCLFVFVHLFVDLVLICKLNRVLREKEEKLKKMTNNTNEIEKQAKENEQSKRRALFMVIFSSIFNLISKVPSMVASFNDVRILIISPYMKNSLQDSLVFNYNSFRTSLSLEYFCSSDRSCLFFQNFGNSLFLISLASILFFLRAFDKNFKDAYKQAFKANK